MFLQQKSLLCEFELDEEKCKGKINNCHIFFETSSSHDCVEKEEEPKAIKKRHHTTFGSHKVKDRAKVQTFHNQISIGPTYNYCGEHGHVKAKCKGELLVNYDMMKWVRKGYILKSTDISYG